MASSSEDRQKKYLSDKAAKVTIEPEQLFRFDFVEKLNLAKRVIPHLTPDERIELILTLSEHMGDSIYSYMEQESIRTRYKHSDISLFLFCSTIVITSVMSVVLTALTVAGVINPSVAVGGFLTSGTGCAYSFRFYREVNNRAERENYAYQERLHKLEMMKYSSSMSERKSL